MCNLVLVIACFSVAMIKYWPKVTGRKELVCTICSDTVHCLAGAMEELITRFAAQGLLSCLSYTTRPTCPGVALATVCWSLPHQLFMKTFLRHAHMTIWETYSSAEVPFLGFCWQKLTSITLKYNSKMVFLAGVCSLLSLLYWRCPLSQARQSAWLDVSSSWTG